MSRSAALPVGSSLPPTLGAADGSRQCCAQRPRCLCACQLRLLLQARHLPGSRRKRQAQLLCVLQALLVPLAGLHAARAPRALKRRPARAGSACAHSAGSPPMSACASQAQACAHTFSSRRSLLPALSRHSRSLARVTASSCCRRACCCRRRWSSLPAPTAARPSAEQSMRAQPTCAGKHANDVILAGAAGGANNNTNSRSPFPHAPPCTLTLPLLPGLHQLLLHQLQPGLQSVYFPLQMSPLLPVRVRLAGHLLLELLCLGCMCRQLHVATAQLIPAPQHVAW